MNTKTNTTTKSMKGAAIEVNAAYRVYRRVNEASKTKLATLNSLPKTKSGKDTKVIRNAKKIAETGSKYAHGEYLDQCRILDEVIKKAIISTNRVYAREDIVNEVLAKHGFLLEKGLTGKVVETAANIKMFNERCTLAGAAEEFDESDARHGQVHYSETCERVYKRSDDGLHLILAFIADNSTYRIAYFGRCPLLTRFGLAFFRDYSVFGLGIFDPNILKDLRVDLSRIGTECGPNIVKQLSAICTLIVIADSLMTKAPFIDTRELELNYGYLAEYLEYGDEACFIRHAGVNRRDLKPCKTNLIVSRQTAARFGKSAEIVASVNADELHEVDLNSLSSCHLYRGRD